MDFNASLYRTESANEHNMIGQKPLTISKQTWNHQLGTVADGIDSTVLDHDSLVCGEKGLKRGDHSSQIRLITGVVLHPLRIQHVMESDHVSLLIHSTTSNTTQLLHVSSNTKQQSKMDAEGTDVGTSLAADPEHAEVSVIIELI